MPKSRPNDPCANPGSGASPGTGVSTCPVHAVLQLIEVTYSGNHRVENDTAGLFPAPEWTPSRQHPVCYTRDNEVEMIAKFKVTQRPTQTDSVEIRATGRFGAVDMEWGIETVSVSPGDSEVTAPLMASSEDLPDEVGIYESATISWEANAAGTGWHSAGTHQNPTYVTLNDPSGTPPYWTLLDVSCRGAHGQTTESGVITHVFDPLRSRAITRKRDGTGLTYWNPANACTATNTPTLLAAANGAGQCGSWAEFLVDMYKVHGIISGIKVLVVRDVPSWQNASVGFLVRRWTFDHPPASAASAWTHFVPSQCRTGVNLPGQRNTTPPPAFYNHFIVKANGVLWDPSYGAGPSADQAAWEVAAIDGLFRAAPGGSPPGNSTQTGYDKSLNTTVLILQMRNTANLALI